MRRTVLYPGYRRVENLRFLQADFQPEELGSLCEAGSDGLQCSLRMRDKNSIVDKEEVLDSQRYILNYIPHYCSSITQTLAKMVREVRNAYLNPSNSQRPKQKKSHNLVFTSFHQT